MSVARVLAELSGWAAWYAATHLSDTPLASPRMTCQL